MAAAAAWGQAPAQQVVDGENLQGLKISQPALKSIPAPFPLGGRFGRVSGLEFRAPEAMTAEDRTVAGNAQAEIARRAELQGFHLEDGSGWGYEQAVCPAFPEHMILEYSRLEAPGASGAGDVTLFSAVVPRGGAGHVRVIPVRRRGYSLWTPASSNALTLNDFNHMVKEGGLNPDWLTLSLCYTALAAGHVRAALVPATRAEEQYPLAAPAKLTVNAKKAGAEVRIVDTAMLQPKGEWIFEYDRLGYLKKVKKTQPRILKTQPVEGIVEARGVPTAVQP